MDWTQSCLAVVPCLNEARAIASLIGDIRQHLPKVLVVDDGSTDGTAEIARAAGATVLGHSRRLGKGRALQDGIQYAMEAGFAWAMLMDGDGQHSPGDMPGFFRAAEEGGDLIIGNRMAQCSRMPLARRAANRWSSRLVSRRTGMTIPDSQCGFRLVRLAAWRQAGVQAQGYEVEAEMILAFARGGWRLKFVPIRTLYGMERSKFHPLADTWRWLCWWRRQGVGQGNIHSGHPVAPAENGGAVP